MFFMGCKNSSPKKDVPALQTQKLGQPITSAKKVVPAQKPEINYAAKKNFKLYTVDQGLSSNVIRNIKEDFSGNIWFATEIGVNKFDGIEYTQYLTNHEIMSIEQGNDSSLWFATYKSGLINFDGKNFIQYTQKDGLPDISFRVVYKDKKGRIWAGGMDRGGLVCYENGKFTSFALHQRSYGNTVSKIYEDKRGIIWVCTFGGGLFSYDGQTFKNYKLKKLQPQWLIDDDLHQNKFMAITEDINGNLWIGTRFSGIYFFKNGAFIEKFSPKLNNFPATCVRDLKSDPSGAVWISTDDGLFKYDHNKMTPFSQKDGLNTSKLGRLFFDSGKNLWVTSGSGANKYREGGFEYHSFESAKTNKITAIKDLKINKSHLNILTEDRIIICDSAFNIIKKTPIPLKPANSLLIDALGNTWVSTFGAGIFKFEKHDSLPTIYKNFGEEGRNTFFTSSVKNKAGKLFFGALEGLVIYDGKTFKNFNERDNLKNYEILCLGIDENEQLWIGSETGISILDHDSFINPAILQKVAITSIQKGLNKGEMLIGTKYFGIWKYSTKNNTIEKFTEENGLASNFIKSIQLDAQSNIWIGTDNGVSLWKKENYTKIPAHKNIFLNFGSEEGFISKDCSINAVSIYKNEIIWGTSKNITRLKYSNDAQKNIKPRVLLKSVKIFFKEINWNDEKELQGISFSKVDKWKNLPANLELSHTQNHVTFSFVGIDWRYPSTIKYSFILENVDKTWSDPSYKNEVTYSSLAPGHYTFKVVAINKNNLKSKNIETIEFTVNPPFWRTWWFYGGTFGLLLISIFSYIKNRENVLKERQKFLESEVANRTHDLQLEKNKVEQQNKKITESIEYAKRIQDAILPPPKVFQNYFKDSFIFFKPKDIVSGDFYWIYEQDDKVFIAVVDCTGHGVPGAFMSIIGKNLLDKIVKELGITQPDLILEELNSELLAFLQQEGQYYEVKDGMNIAICVIHKESLMLDFSGSYNPMYLLRNNDIQVFKGDRIPIGKPKYLRENTFVCIHQQLQKNDLIYLFTDGFPDQKGGPESRKFFYQQFRELLLSFSSKPMLEQARLLDIELQNWKGNNEQTDDVCVIGIKI